MRAKNFHKCVGIFTALTLVMSCLFTPLPQANAASTFMWQSKILDLGGAPIITQLKIIIVLWLTANPTGADYNTDKTPNAASPNYVYSCEYTVTPNKFGVVNVEVGSGAGCALPDPLPSSDMYLQAGIRKATEAVTQTDWIVPPNKSTAVLGAVTSQLQSGLGGVDQANLIIYDSTTKKFEALKSVDMGTTNFSYTFGDALTKKVLVSWDASSQWWVFPTPMNFTGGLYLNGVDITTLLGGGGSGLASYVGQTTSSTDGNIGGYLAADSLCNAAHSGSHVCTTEEIMNSVRLNPTGMSTVIGYINNGPPSFTANANDCNGWTTNQSSGYYGAYFAGDSNGGQLWMNTCNQSRKLLCCL